MSDKPNDPADKGLDAFQTTTNHRAGCGDDKLARLVDYLRRQPRATLASGEGALLLAEIDRLRGAAKNSADHYADARAEIDRLRERLTAVEAERDGAYGERNRVVAWAARMASALGFDVTVTKTAIQGWDAAWHNCIYVQSPEGQVSWHFHDREVEVFADLPRGAVAWDGHSTSQKYDRVRTARYTNRAERILAALREPSESVVEEAASKMHDASEPDDDCRIAWEDCIPWYHITRRKMATAAIRAAVKAAEQEVGHE